MPIERQRVVVGEYLKPVSLDVAAHLADGPHDRQALLLRHGIVALHRVQPEAGIRDHLFLPVDRGLWPDVGELVLPTC